MAITNRKNWGIIKQNNIYGVPYRSANQINKVKIGDNIAFFVKKETTERGLEPSSLVGIYSVTSNVYEEDSDLFEAPVTNLKEAFPLRIKLKPLNIFKDPIVFKDIVPNLKFVKNKINWGGQFQGISIRGIPDVDFQFILDQSK
jgi:predicted RNA-binding protein